MARVDDWHPDAEDEAETLALRGADYAVALADLLTTLSAAIRAERMPAGWSPKDVVGDAMYFEQVEERVMLCFVKTGARIRVTACIDMRQSTHAVDTARQQARRRYEEMQP